MIARRVPLALAAAFVLAIGLTARADAPALAATVPAPIPTADSLVRVNSTSQTYNFLKPWTKRPPSTRRGIGVVLEGGRVLVTAELVANHTYVELERASASRKVAADVVRVDYESNLALLAPADAKFLADAPAVKLADGVRIGTRVNVVQLESNGSAAFTPGVVTTISVAPYPSEGIALLGYRISAPLQYRENSFTLPVFDGDRLAGLLMRYDARSQSADLVSQPVIANFLARAGEEPYRGFPRAGLSFAPTRDPQFRRYLDLEDRSGVYVVSVQTGSPAEKSGLRKGDVILSVDGADIDADGNFTHPDFGRIPFSFLVSTAHQPGGAIPLKVLREGRETALSLPLEPRDPATVISETAINDAAPRYYVLGGLVFQELSRSYLREWGVDWRASAPPRLVYLDEFQDELPADRGKIVFLSEVLPADANVGFEDVSSIVVEKINGRPIRRLEDIAEAAKHPEGGFHRIELESEPGVIYLDASEASESGAEIQKSYGLPALDNLGPASQP